MEREIAAIWSRHGGEIALAFFREVLWPCWGGVVAVIDGDCVTWEGARRRDWR